jgi:tetratricopeptide (TPR) repeat protein
MKKSLLFLLVFFAVGLPCFSQKHKSESDTAIYWSIYNNALNFGDLDVAKNALYHIISLQPENRKLYDSLATLYFSAGAYNQSLLTCEKATPTTQIAEIKAYSLRNLGDIKSALPLFEELYKNSSSAEHGYQVATIQFALKRLGECVETASKIINDPEAKKLQVVITTGQDQSMKVSYYAAALNLRGVVYMELGKKDPARVEFQKAIAEEPEFTLAKKNLESLDMPSAK